MYLGMCYNLVMCVDRSIAVAMISDICCDEYTALGILYHSFTFHKLSYVPLSHL